VARKHRYLGAHTLISDGSRAILAEVIRAGPLFIFGARATVAVIIQGLLGARRADIGADDLRTSPYLVRGTCAGVAAIGEGLRAARRAGYLAILFCALPGVVFQTQALITTVRG